MDFLLLAVAVAVSMGATLVAASLILGLLFRLLARRRQSPRAGAFPQP